MTEIPVTVTVLPVPALAVSKRASEKLTEIGSPAAMLVARLTVAPVSPS